MYYYLIARNKSDNSYKVLKLSDKWYLDESKAKGNYTRANDLEAIDLVTSQFKSREQLAERLCVNGFIDDPNVDIFIASKRKKDGKSYIKFDEVIYGPKGNKRIDNLRGIASKSLECGFSDAKKDVGAMKTLADDVITRCFFSEEFYTMLMDGETNVSNRVAAMLSDIPRNDDVPYEKASEEDFGFNNYHEVRSVIEALNRFDGLGKSSREDRVLLNQDFIEKNESDRMALVPMLALELDKDFCEGQLSLFDYFNRADRDRVRQATETITANKPRVSKRVEDPKKNVSLDEKKKEIFRVLDTLPVNAFKSNGKKGFEFNSGVFNHPLLEDEEKELHSLLTGNMPKFFRNYICYKKRRDDAYSLGEYSEGSELQECLDSQTAAIQKRFLSSKCIENTYRWCMLYEGCRKRDESYGTAGIGNGIGDVDAKVFGKK